MIRTLGVEPRRTRKRKRFQLYAAEPAIPSRIIFNRIPFEKGESEVIAGRWRRVMDSKTGEHIGYQIMPLHLQGEKAHV